MISNQTLKPRTDYLNKLLAFKDTEPVKIITGIRRCGKSSLLKLMIKHLQEQGIEDYEYRTSPISFLKTKFSTHTSNLLSYTALMLTSVPISFSTNCSA